MLQQVRDTMDGATKSGKPTTKSGHISDFDFEPVPPLLVDDEPPTDQQKLDALDLQLQFFSKAKLPTPSGRAMDTFDSLLSKRLEERIRQIQVFRQQLETIQLRNEREIVAAQVKKEKILDKLRRTKDRLDAVTEELKRERLGMSETCRPTNETSAALTRHSKRTGAIAMNGRNPYWLTDDFKIRVTDLQANDDGNYWGVGAAFISEQGVIPSKTKFMPSKMEIPRYEHRNWNEEYQGLLKDIFSKNMQKKYQTLRSLGEMQLHFKELVLSIGGRIVDEMHVPYAFKSLKPTSLPRKRKMISELDATDVLREFAYGEDEWIPVYKFHNIHFEIAEHDSAFYGSETNAAKAYSNELRGIRYISTAAIEQGLHFPLTMIMEYHGYRVLATASLPPMADPRDLIDSTKAQSISSNAGLSGEVDDWEAAQQALRRRVQRVGKLLNLAQHTIRIEDQADEIALVSDSQIFIGADRRDYVMSCARVFPSEPPTYPLSSEFDHLYKVFRPELLRTLRTPINADAFTGFVGKNFREDNTVSRELFNRLKKNVIPGFASYLETQADDGLEFQNTLSLLLHRHGINMRFCGLVGYYTKNKTLKRAMAVEMIARYCKSELRKRWRMTVENGTCAEVEFCELAAEFWDKAVPEGLREKFVGANLIQGSESWISLCDVHLVAKRLAHLTGIVLVEGTEQILKTRGKIRSSDIMAINPQVVGNNLIPLECVPGFAFMCEALEAENPEIRVACLSRVVEIFESARRQHPDTAEVLTFGGDAYFLLAKDQRFFAARESLDIAEGLYRSALCKRPQQVELLYKLADLHCAQAKLARLDDSASRLRGRAGARLIQEICFEWEKGHALRDQIDHRLGHILKLSKNDVAAVFLATNRFSNFVTIDFSDTPEVGKYGILRSVGQRAELQDLNLSKCSKATDKIIGSIVRRTHKTLTALNLSHCTSIGIMGIHEISRHSRKLKKLVLDHAIQVDDGSLSELFQRCTALTEISIRGLPRITTKSAINIPKFCRKLVNLDLSETPQITGAVLNEIAQLCPSFSILRADGCHSIDENPIISFSRCKTPLTEVSLSGCIRMSSLAIKNIAAKCKGITLLDLSGCNKLDDMVLTILAEKANFPLLTSLDLTKCGALTTGFIEMAQARPKLTFLRLGQCTQVSEDAVSTISASCGQLQDLSLSACIGVTMNSSSQIIMGCKSLTALSFAHCASINDVTLSCMAQHATGLKYLDLSGCYLITESKVEAVIRANTRLDHLKLYGCRLLGDKPLEALGEVCPLLLEFHLSLSDKVTDHGLMRLVTGCPLLRELRLTNCAGLSHEIRQAVALQMPWISFAH